jgi:hypothetical protein
VVEVVGMAVEIEGQTEGGIAMGMAGRIDVRMAGIRMDCGRDANERDDGRDGGLAQGWVGWMVKTVRSLPLISTKLQHREQPVVEDGVEVVESRWQWKRQLRRWLIKRLTRQSTRTIEDGP